MTKFDKFYMNTALAAAELSHAIRLKVGSVAVSNGNIIAFGYNGTPAGDDNNCEYKVYYKEPKPGEYITDKDEFPYEDEVGIYRLVTKDTVLHAEENTILKLASSANSARGATLYVTHSPCIRCARMIHSAGFTRLIYANAYYDETPIEFLKSKNIECELYE